jgi:hypothetical protein
MTSTEYDGDNPLTVANATYCTTTCMGNIWHDFLYLSAFGGWYEEQNRMEKRTVHAKENRGLTQFTFNFNQEYNV